MGTEKTKNLKDVLEAVPAGYLVDAKWLTDHGVAYESFRDYVKRGWLERLTRGVFRRPAPNASKSNTPDWRACLLSLQHIMHYQVHVGGMSALRLQGHAHYLSLGEKSNVWLYGNIPNWLTKLQLSAEIETRNNSLFVDATLGLSKDAISPQDTLPWDWKIRMSLPERAILEALDELPNHESFHNLDMVFESLTNLRPRMLSALLHDCKKIKVKRLFFIFADRHDHAWRKRIDPEEYDLGSGDRALVRGGKIHPRYRIMIPEEFVTKERSGGA